MVRKATQVFTGTGQAATVEGFLKPVTIAVALTGTWTSLTVTFEVTLDGINWNAIELMTAADMTTTSLVTTATGVGHFVSNIQLSIAAFRVRCSTFSSGTAPTATVRAV